MEKVRESLKVKKERAILVAAILRRQETDGLSELTALISSYCVNFMDANFHVFSGSQSQVDN